MSRHHYDSLVVMCPPLDSPMNGNEFQDVATYTCSESFSLIGPANRTCQANGEWSGEEPSCQSKFVSISF